MTPLDGAVVVAYLAAVLARSLAFARRQRIGGEYFLAGRAMAGRTLAMSMMANQVSAISLIGAPAFVALRAGGGLTWLQYELALLVALATSARPWAVARPYWPRREAAWLVGGFVALLVVLTALPGAVRLASG